MPNSTVNSPRESPVCAIPLRRLPNLFVIRANSQATGTLLLAKAEA